MADDDLRSDCGAVEDGVPPNLLEALDCSLPLDRALSILKMYIGFSGPTDPDAEPLALALDAETISAAAAMTDDSVQQFVIDGWDAMQGQVLDDSECNFLVRIALPTDPTKLGQPLVLAVGLVLIAEVIGKSVCVQLPPACLGVPGQFMSMRRLLVEALVSQKRQAKTKTCPNRVLGTLIRMMRLQLN